MLDFEEFTKARNQVMAKISKCKIAMIELIGKGAYENFHNKIRLFNKLNSIVSDIKTLEQEDLVPISLLTDLTTLEIGIFNDKPKSRKVSEILKIVTEELEEVKDSIKNYLDVNPEFAVLHNEMIVLITTERKLKVDANSHYGRTTANPNLQPTFSKEVHEVLKQSTGKDQQLIGRAKHKPE